MLEFSDTARRTAYDAVVVGSGPNGLAAAITLAREGLSVLVVEAQPGLGGATRSAELTRPGFVHDVCSSVHALGVLSPFFRELPLAVYGLEWRWPTLPVAHPLADGSAAIGARDVDETAWRLGARDGAAYRRCLQPFVDSAALLLPEILRPVGVPGRPFLMARFTAKALRSATRFARGRFHGAAARALFAGHAAHSVQPLENMLTAGVALLLSIAAHAGGWPVARGGSQRLADALAAYLLSLGGEIVVRRPVRSLAELPASRVVLFDVAPRRLSHIAGSALPIGYRRRLDGFRYGPGVFKVDWALDGPIPWRAAECAQAGTVHVGGTLEEVAAAERAPWRGAHAEKPFVLLVQQSVADSTRAPHGQHTAWGYCHVPHGSSQDCTAAIEAQVERFAPGFGDRILARHVTSSGEMESSNANCIGGDITGGVMDLRQTLARPVLARVPYATPNPRLYLCSASTPPGGGVHGMCGFLAAKAALRRAFGREVTRVPGRGG